MSNQHMTGKGNLTKIISKCRNELLKYSAKQLISSEEVEQWIWPILTQWVDSWRQYVNRAPNPNFGNDLYIHNAFQQEEELG